MCHLQFPELSNKPLFVFVTFFCFASGVLSSERGTEEEATA